MAQLGEYHYYIRLSVALISRKKERTTDLVIQAIRSGFRGIDTACQPKVNCVALNVD